MEVPLISEQKYDFLNTTGQWWVIFDTVAGGLKILFLCVIKSQYWYVGEGHLPYIAASAK